MKTTKMLTILVVAFGLTVCLAQLCEAEPMGTAFTYQGHLYDNDEAADGLYDFQFKLFDDSNDPCTGMQLGSPIDINDLDVIDGYFTIVLDFGSDVFDGNAVWLEVGVRPGEQDDPCDYIALSPRQEVTPVPYALQTRGIFVDNAGNVGIGTTSPAAKLAALHSGGNYGRLGTTADGAFGQSSASGGSGVAGVSTGVGNGVYGRSNNGKGVHGVSSDGLAGYFNGDVTLTKPSGQGGGELVLRTATYNEPGRYRIRFENNGLGVFTGDDTQKQQFAFVSKWGKTREYDARLKVHGKASGSWGTYIAFTHDGNDGLIETDVGDIVLSPAGNVGIGTTNPDAKLEVNGDLKVTGAYKGDIGPNNGAPFPRPAYDSGLVTIAQGTSVTFTHDIGGNVDNYVVDMQFYVLSGAATYGIHNRGLGTSEFDSSTFVGAYWRSLTTSDIVVTREADDYYVREVRIRIWVYN